MISAAEKAESTSIDMYEFVVHKAPVLAPQLYPRSSSLFDAPDDPSGCVIGIFSTAEQQKAAAASLMERGTKAKQALGCAVELVLLVDVDVRARRLLIHGLRFVGKIEAVLYNAKRLLNIEMGSRDPAEIEPYIAHFRAKNGYEPASSSSTSFVGNPAMVVQEVHSAAYNLSVVLDNMQGWQTRVRVGHIAGSSSANGVDDNVMAKISALRASKAKNVPLKPTLDAVLVLEELFSPNSSTLKKRKKGLSGKRSGGKVTSSLVESEQEEEQEQEQEQEQQQEEEIKKKKKKKGTKGKKQQEDPEKTIEKEPKKRPKEDAEELGPATMPASPHSTSLEAVAEAEARKAEETFFRDRKIRKEGLDAAMAQLEKAGRPPFSPSKEEYSSDEDPQPLNRPRQKLQQQGGKRKKKSNKNKKRPSGRA